MAEFEDNLEHEHDDLIQRLESMWQSPPPSLRQSKSSASAVRPVINGYRIDEIIGIGGMAVVYRAWDELLKRFVALKMLSRPTLPQPTIAARFRQEALAAAQLSHPGIVPVYAVGDSDGTPWFAMLLVEGATLERRIATDSPLGGPAAARLMLAVSQAVHYAHQQGIIHRDLKPSNILIDSDDQPLVCDFGLAKLSEMDSELTCSGEVIGSASWMSPEQARGDSEAVTRRSDVYSIGAILYQCLVGRRPFQSANQLETLRQVCDVDPIAPRQIDPTIDRDLETICLRCLRKSPDQRFETADDLAKELQRYLSDEPIESRPVRNYQRIIRWSRRQPQLAMALASGVLLAMLLSVAVPWLLIEQAQRRQAEAEAVVHQQSVEEHRKLAATEKYFATLSRLRSEASVKPVGWKANDLDRLKSVAKLEVGGKDPVELRSILANILSENDLEEVASFADGIDPRGVAFSPDGKMIAIGEIRPDSICDDVCVYLYGLETNSDGKVTVTPLLSRSLYEHEDIISRTTRRFQQGGGWEGAWSICFSSDSQRLVVATRHGRILEWNLKSPEAESPRVICSYGNGFLDKWNSIRFLAGDRLLAGVRGDQELHPLVIDAHNGEEIWRSDRPVKMVALLPSTKKNGAEAMLCVRKAGLEMVSRFTDPIKCNLAGPEFDGFEHDPESQTSLVKDSASGGRCAIYDIHNRRLTMEFSRKENQYEMVESARFGADTLSVAALIYGKQDDLRLRVWDGLSGAIDVEHPILQQHAPVVRVSQPAGLLLAGFNTGAKLYRIDGPSVHKNSPSDRPFQSLPGGPRKIESFALDVTGQRIALLDAESDGSQQQNVRILDLDTGDEEKCWALHSSDERLFDFRHVPGVDLCFDGTDAIILSSRLPAFLCRLSDDGIVPVAESQPTHLVNAKPVQTKPESITFTLPISKQTPEKSYKYWLPSFSFRISAEIINRSVGAKEAVLNISVDHGDGQSEQHVLAAGELQLGKSNWQLKAFPHRGTARSGQTVKIVVTSKLHKLTIADDDSAADNGRELSGIEIGQATLTGFSVNDRMGPVGKLSNGDWLTVDDDTTLERWNFERSGVGSWGDTLNHSAHIRDIAIGNRSAIVGTRWGNVFHLSDDKYESTELRGSSGWETTRQIDELTRDRPGGDTLEEIVSVAIDAQDRFAIAGNRGGELISFDLKESAANEVQQHRFQAHDNVITQVAISPDGDTVFSACNDRQLKVWRREGDQLSLFFELDTLDNPIIDMQVTPNGRQLFYLCRDERGVRIIDLPALDQEFRKLNLLMP